MAILYPCIDKIKSFKPYPTEGELELINRLTIELNDDYEVYFQPFLEGDNPDIVVLHKTGGVFIIEVKDWNLQSYKYNSQVGKYGEFRLNSNNCVIGNPFQQVNKYKDNIFGMHIEELFMKKIKEPKIFGQLVKVGVYFHKANNHSLKEKFKSKAEYVKYIKIWGYDSNISEDIKKSLKENCIYMNECLYNEFKRIFQPSYHRLTYGKDIVLTNKQKALSTSKGNCNIKIKGVSGSGKTIVLANRAVSAIKRTGNRVLILTYNITLRNYIKDRISEVREDFSWDRFEIINYHEFIVRQLRKLGETIYFENEDIDKKDDNEELDKHLMQIFDERKKELCKYDTILIDEGQDFKKIWFEIIKNNFLKDNGEFIIFADEKQNIYDRDLDSDKKIVTNIPGRWNELSKSFRVKSDIYKLAMEYQKYFLNSKYNIDPINYEQLNFFGDSQDIKYKFDKNISYNEIFDEVKLYIRKNNIHNNNVCIIAMEIEHLRNLEYDVRKNSEEKFKFERTMEKKEEYEDICKKYENNKEKIKTKLEELRRIRKRHFQLDCKVMKLSTVHSFKGWEIETLVIIIDKDDEKANEELIYTALTRCKKNLLIFNRGNIKLDEFFRKNIKNNFD